MLLLRSKKCGKTLREMAPVAMTHDFPARAKIQIVLSGRKSPAALPEKPYDLIWLNPPPVLSENQKLLIEGANRKLIVWGDMRADADPRDLRTWFWALPNARWKDAVGKGLYLWDLAPMLR